MTTSHKHTHMERYRQIATTLARHGLGYLVGVLGLERFVPFHRGLLKHPRRALPYTQPEHVRMALEELGATFSKLGQILSTRNDLLLPAYLAEFVRLQDAAPTILPEAVQETYSPSLMRPRRRSIAVRPKSLSRTSRHLPMRFKPRLGSTLLKCMLNTW